MRATISHLLHALKRRRSSDEGFSLIELIVVVAILGILVAIAIPVFANIQNSAKVNALKTAAANGATVVASQIASGVAAADVPTELAKSNTADYTLVASGDLTKIDGFCVTATASGSLAGANPATATSGPACTP